MKAPSKKTCTLLILMAAFALTLAVAGDVSASPCIRVCFASDPTCTETCGDDQPIDHTALVNGRLWYGTDSAVSQMTPSGQHNAQQSANMPEGPKNWSYKLYYDGPDNEKYTFNGYWDYKVIVTGALQTDKPGTYAIQLISGIGDGLLTVSSQSQATVGGPLPGNVLYDFKELDGLTNLDTAVKSRLEFAELMVTFTDTAQIIPFSVVYHYISPVANIDANNIYDPLTYPTDYNPDPNDRRPSGFDLRFKDYSQSGIYFSHDCVPVPEPATMLLLGFGLVGMGVAGYGRKRFKR